MDLKNIVQGSSEWHSWRNLGIGASESAAILGLSPYSTPFQVWQDKTGRRDAFEGNLATQRGQDLEGKARAKYELISMEDMPPALGVHPKYEIMRASFDGKSLDSKKILEIKVPGAETHAGAKKGIVPAHYMIQIQHQLLVSGADSCDFFTYSYKDSSHALVEVLPDLDLQVKILTACLNFWEAYISRDVSPPLTSMDTKEVHDGEILEICSRLEKQKDTMKKAEADLLKQRVIKIGEHNKIRCGNVLISVSKLTSGKESFRMTISKDEAAS